MTDRRRLAFDPNSPGAQHLLRAARAACAEPVVQDEISVVLTKACSLRTIDSGGLTPRVPGERVTLHPAVARALIRKGVAELADQ